MNNKSWYIHRTSTKRKCELYVHLFGDFKEDIYIAIATDETNEYKRSYFTREDAIKLRDIINGQRKGKRYLWVISNDVTKVNKENSSDMQNSKIDDIEPNSHTWDIKNIYTALDKVDRQHKEEFKQRKNTIQFKQFEESTELTSDELKQEQDKKELSELTADDMFKNIGYRCEFIISKEFERLGHFEETDYYLYSFPNSPIEDKYIKIYTNGKFVCNQVITPSEHAAIIKKLEEIKNDKN